MLHGAPSSERKYLFLKQNRLSLCIAGVLSTCILLTGNVFFILAHPGFMFFGLFILVTTYYLFISYMVGFAGREFDHKKHSALVAKWFDRSDEASVDIYLPICGEPMDIIANTWNWVSNLAELYCGVKVHVLDDGKSDGARDLAKTYGFNYIRRETNELKKAGNMRNAFRQTSSEFIMILDADFCPRADFLLETLPYFFEDEKIAIVQTPQFFDDYPWLTWVQRGAGSIQELFYRLIQVNRNTFNGAICVGTNAVYRRSALEPFGGTAAIEYSEDVHTGFQIIMSGQKIQYIPINLAGGLCPETMKQYFTQQYRWALGSISLFFAKKFWEAKLSVMQRVCYLSGMLFYITTGLSVIFGAIPSVVMLLFFPEKIHWYNLLFSLPSLAFSTCFMWWWQKTPLTWDQLRCRYVSYFSHLFALKDFLGGTLEEWKPTGAKTQSNRYESFRRVFTYHWAITTILVFMLILFRLIKGDSPENFIILYLLTCYNLFLIHPMIIEIFE